MHSIEDAKLNDEEQSINSKIEIPIIPEIVETTSDENSQNEENPTNSAIDRLKASSIEVMKEASTDTTEKTPSSTESEEEISSPLEGIHPKSYSEIFSLNNSKTIKKIVYKSKKTHRH